MSKKTCLLLNNKYIMKIGQDFLDILYSSTLALSLSFSKIDWIEEARQRTKSLVLQTRWQQEEKTTIFA